MDTQTFVFTLETSTHRRPCTNCGKGTFSMLVRPSLPIAICPKCLNNSITK